MSALPNSIVQTCEYSLFDSVTQLSTKERINWPELGALVLDPFKGIEQKTLIPCLAAHDNNEKTKEAVLKGGYLSLLWIDIDDGNAELESIEEKLGWLAIESFLIYSTFSAEATNKHWRVLIELAEPMPANLWELAQQVLTDVLEGDSSATRLQQILFLPVDNGSFYKHHISTGEALNPKGLPLPFQNKINDLESLEAAKQATPKPRTITPEQTGVINLVNQAYEMEQILDHYQYKRIGKKWLHPQSESGTAGIVLLDGRYFSHHSSDPLNDGFTHDAFDLFVYWRFNGNSKEALKTLANELDPQGQKERQGNYRENNTQTQELAVLGGYIKEPDIIPLCVDLIPVEPFDYDLLPSALHDWIKDIQERVQCPPDFLAIGAMIGIAGLVGRKAAIYPKAKDDWLVTPNLWGAMIGRPSIMKTPALSEVLKPLQRLIKKAEEEHQAKKADYEADQVLSDALEKAAKSALEKAAKGGGNDPSSDLDVAKENYRKIIEAKEENPAPSEKRYIVNDATVEALGEKLNQNTNGLILVRDELVGWLKGLDREDNSNERAFYLECFSGSGTYVYDRIGRGTVKIESTTVSIVGGIQPSKLAPYVSNAVSMGAGDDGFIQRFQLAVYPDDAKDWQNVDRFPNAEAKNKAFAIYEQLAELEPRTDWLNDDAVIGLRFTNEAQLLFNEWRESLETEVRADGIHPAIESHLAKFRSLIPSLALLLCLTDNIKAEQVDIHSLQKAIKWGAYLKSHAMRIYNGFIEPQTIAANKILKERSKLNDSFKAKEVQQKGWSGLVTTDQTKASLNVLIEHGYLIEITEPTGGRPSVSFRWNKTLN